MDTATTAAASRQGVDYRLSTYNTLEWVLERHKERTPKDRHRESSNIYRFADYKEQVIDLLRA